MKHHVYFRSVLSTDLSLPTLAPDCARSATTYGVIAFLNRAREYTKEPLIKSSGSRVSDEMSSYARCRFRVDIRDSRPGSAAPQMGS